MLLTLNLEERQVQNTKHHTNANVGYEFGKKLFLRGCCRSRLDLLFPLLEETVTSILLFAVANVGMLPIALLDQCTCFSFLSGMNRDTRVIPSGLLRVE